VIISHGPDTSERDLLPSSLGAVRAGKLFGQFAADDSEWADSITAVADDFGSIEIALGSPNPCWSGMASIEL